MSAAGYGGADSVNGAGTIVQTPQESRDVLRTLATQDDASQNRLYEMAQRGTASQGDIDFLNERAQAVATRQN